MSTSKYVFSQLTSFLNRSQSNDYVRKYKGDYYVKHFTCWNQLLVMMFGQLSSRESLRDLIVALEAHQPKCYRMGMGTKPVTKTTLARAYPERDNRFFEDFAFYMMSLARRKRIEDIFKLKPQDQEVLGYHGERSPYPDKRGHNNLLPCDYCPT